jgi:hypothetical protein
MNGVAPHPAQPTDQRPSERVSPTHLAKAIEEKKSPKVHNTAPPSGSSHALTWDVLKDYQRYTITAAVLREAIEERALPQDAPENEINDRSKSDWMAKIIVILQLADFFITAIVRAAEQLPVSSLEAFVCAFAVCSILVYGFLLFKPKNPNTPYILAVYEGDVPSVIRNCDHKIRGIKAGKPPWLVYFPTAGSTRSSWTTFVTLFSGAVIFGAIHLAGWDLYFVSRTDRWVRALTFPHRIELSD